LADYDRFTGTVSWHIDLPMDGVPSDILPAFLQSAGERGWELCASFPSGIKGFKRVIDGKRDLKECQDAAEVITLIFKRVGTTRG
jgi:hypothetical protein